MLQLKHESSNNIIHEKNKESSIIESQIKTPHNSPIMINKLQSEENINIDLEKEVKIFNKPKKTKRKQQDNYSIIHEIKADNVDELKERRSNIIIIRQYLQTFHEKLKKIFGSNKDKFMKNLIKLNNEQLLCILEQIRCELKFQEIIIFSIM